MISVGSHCLLELFGCPSALLDDAEYVRKALRRAAESAGSTLLEEVSREFEPQGVTALGLLAESHISIHTWPEIGYVACDAFTCGGHALPERACESFIASFRPETHQLHKVSRGPPAAATGPVGTIGSAATVSSGAVSSAGRGPRQARVAPLERTERAGER